MFDKLLYWKRRKEGKRGQTGGDPVYPRRGVKVPPTVVAIHDKPDWTPKQPTKKALLKNTKRARKHHEI